MTRRRLEVDGWGDAGPSRFILWPAGYHESYDDTLENMLTCIVMLIHGAIVEISVTLL